VTIYNFIYRFKYRFYYVEEIIIKETLPVKETLISFKGNKEYSDKEYKLNKLISVNKSVIVRR